NVCRIFDIGFHSGDERVAFLTMEFLPGETLHQRISDRGRMRPEEALPILEQMVAGLNAAHAAGVVHRDFKSQNVMLSDGRVVVSDFGLARSAESGDGSSVSTESTGLIGSPLYMAPEQVAGRDLDRRADIYAVGI